ncbi:hypothetical protein D3C75_1010320 [compost metagenome]
MTEKAFAGRMIQDHDHPWAGAELTAAQGDRGGQALGQAFGISFQRGRQSHQRVDRAQFAEERDRAWTLIGQFPQGSAALIGAGKGNGSNLWMLDQVATGTARGAFDQGQHALW